MDELEQRVMDAFQSAPDLMGGLMYVYRLGVDDAGSKEQGSDAVE